MRHVGEFLAVLALVASCGTPAVPAPQAVGPVSPAPGPSQSSLHATVPPERALPAEPVASTSHAPAPGAFVVHVVDLGTGLGVFVEGHDFALVYDAGSNDDLGTGRQNRFLAFLSAVRPDLKQIDHVVLSHPHRDHVELLPDVLDNYSVGNVWDSGAINPICGYRRFVQAIANHPDIAYHTANSAPGTHSVDFEKRVCGMPETVDVRSGAQIVEGAPVALGNAATMTFLHVDGTRHGTKFNDNSLVTMLDLGASKVLLMGDGEAGGRAKPSKPPADGSVEGHVLEKYGRALKADVLIVGHHGSKSSTRRAFLQAVSPSISVISAGPEPYGGVVLPDHEVVDELKAASTLFETDIDDAACAANPKKIGTDADGKPGGCDNVRIDIHDGKVVGAYERLSD